METVEEVLQTVGKTIGAKDLSLGDLLRVVVIALVGWLVIRLLVEAVDRMLDRSKSVVAIKAYIHTAVNVVLWILLVLMLAGTLDVDVTSVIAVLSVAGLAVSMALQSTLSNLAGGLVLLVAKPFVVGDFVEADGISGTITAVNMAYTMFTTPDNKEIFVPNSQLSDTKIINYNRLGKRRMDLKIAASYDAPTARVRAALQEAVAKFPQVLSEPAPAIYISEYQASSIEYLVRLWTASGDYWNVYFALIEEVREAFDRHKVEMTYNHLNVHLMEK